MSANCTCATASETSALPVLPLEVIPVRTAFKVAVAQLRAEREAAAGTAEAGGAGGAPKRGRGRPVGSRTKNHSVEGGGAVAGSSEEAARRMLAQRKLTSKINYTALADLFADAQPGASGQSRPSPRACFCAMYLDGPEHSMHNSAHSQQIQQACGQPSSQGNHPRILWAGCTFRAF